MRVRELATGEELADEITGTRRGRARRGRPTVSTCSTHRPTTRCARRDLAPPPRHAVSRRRARPRTSPTSASSSASARPAASVDLIAPGSKTSTEVWLIPADDPTAEPRVRAAAAPRTSSTTSTTGATGSSIVTNLDAPDFRVMTAPHRRAWRRGPSSSPTRRAGGSPTSSRSPGTSSLHEWNHAQPRVRDRAARRVGRACSTSATSRTTSSSAPTREWDTTTLRLSIPVAHRAGVGVRRRPRDR